MSRIRIAQRAWEGSSAVDEITSETCGVDLIWVEIDGYRIDRYIEGVSIQGHKDAPNFRIGDIVPEITLRILGTVEIVYLDTNLNEIGHAEVDPLALLGSDITTGTVNAIPDASDLEAVVRQRNEARSDARTLRAMLNAQLVEPEIPGYELSGWPALPPVPTVRQDEYLAGVRAFVGNDWERYDDDPGFNRAAREAGCRAIGLEVPEPRTV